MNEIIQNTSKGGLKKLFGKDHITGIQLVEDGFLICMEKSNDIQLPFSNIKRIEHQDYFKNKPMAMRTVRIQTNDGKEYVIDAKPEIDQVKKIMAHFATYDLAGQDLNDFENLDIKIGFVYGKDIRIKNGNLILPTKKEEIVYPISTMKHYAFNRVNTDLGMMFEGKKTGVNIFQAWNRNIYLLEAIMAHSNKPDKTLPI